MSNIKKFATFAEHLPLVNNLTHIRGVITELERLTKLIHHAFPELQHMCHCGAIDYANDLLVVYTVNNAAFYKVNQYIPLIEDLLVENHLQFAKILIKSNPQRHLAKPVTKQLIGADEYAMLAKFATAINRPDLLKPWNAEIPDSQRELEWKIDLTNTR